MSRLKLAAVALAAAAALFAPSLASAQSDLERSDTTPTGLLRTTLKAVSRSARARVWPRSILRPGSSTRAPSIDTRPRAISPSASRREHTPLWASQRFIRWGSASS